VTNAPVEIDWPEDFGRWLDRLEGEARSGDEARDSLRGEAMTDGTTPPPSRFVRGNEHLDRLLSDPQLAADVAQADDMDHAYAMNLAMIRAMIRKAAQLTQVEVAKRLGVGQAAVSRMESRGDMLLPTLYDYLTATGADTASIVVTVHGRRIELDLGSLRGRPETATH
jgi:Helix-turn-helix domain